MEGLKEQIVKKGRSTMLIPTLVMALLAICLVVVGFAKGKGQHVEGTKLAMDMVVQILPLLCCALVVAGMVQVLVPKESLSRWIGEEAGLRGIFVGTLAGALTPGGPYVSLPLAAGFVRSGAGVGTMVAFLTGWSLWAFARIPMEVGVLGWKFTLIRFSSTFLLPPVAGLVAHLVFGHVK